MSWTGEQPQAGFTLLELLLSLALTATIASFLIAGFHGVRRAATSSHDHAAAEEVDAAARLLRGLIAKTLAATTIDEADGVSRQLFQGTTNSVTFVTLSEATAFHGGPMRVRLSWQGGPPLSRTGQLVIRTAVLRSDPRLLFESEPIVLLRDVAAVSLSYFGAPDLGEQPQWHAEWLGRDRLPLAVLLDVELAGAVGPRRLSLQTQLRLAQSP